jgi:hypothetical protein
MGYNCPKCNHELRMDDGISALRAEYYSSVRSTAKDIHDDYRKGMFRDRDGLLTRIHEECDGDQWVIYTFRAQIVALVSDNSGAFADQGLDGIMRDGEINWSAIAYCAMERDVIEALGAGGEDWEGIDVNAEPCGACEGSGEVTGERKTRPTMADGSVVTYGLVDCDDCDGKGYV